MKSSNIRTKLLAILLIFTLTSANFLFVGETFASEIITEVFSSSKTNENVEFSAYFETGSGTKTASVISDVNNKDLAINLSLEVKESGYLKNAQITGNEPDIKFLHKYTHTHTHTHTHYILMA